MKLPKGIRVDANYANQTGQHTLEQLYQDIKYFGDVLRTKMTSRGSPFPSIISCETEYFSIE